MSENTNIPFSQRFGYQSPGPEITVREDAPGWLREWLPRTANEFIPAIELRQLTRRLLTEPPYVSNAPMIEVLAALRSCEWPAVYDFAEALYAALAGQSLDEDAAQVYEDRLNKLFKERGVGWQMRSGKIQARGSEPFEAATRKASETLVDRGRLTAAREIQRR